jgi:hypothetical protein
MLYRVIEHYDTENDFIIESNFKFDNQNEKECFICLDIMLNDDTPIVLLDQKIYCQTCLCNGWVHNICLKKWYDKNESCPICRGEMFKPVGMREIFIDRNPFIIFVYSTRFHDMLIIIKKLILASFLFCLINVILSVINYNHLDVNNNSYYNEISKNIKYNDIFYPRNKAFLYNSHNYNSHNYNSPQVYLLNGETNMSST